MCILNISQVTCCIYYKVLPINISLCLKSPRSGAGALVSTVSTNGSGRYLEPSGGKALRELEVGTCGDTAQRHTLQVLHGSLQQFGSRVLTHACTGNREEAVRGENEPQCSCGPGRVCTTVPLLSREGPALGPRAESHRGTSPWAWHRVLDRTQPLQLASSQRPTSVILRVAILGG